MGRTAIVLGATGLVGRRVVEQLAADSRYNAVVALVRRAPGWQLPKVEARAVDFDRLADTDLPPADDVFCCLGTTIKVAGSREAFRRVDYDYVLRVARLALARGATRLMVISALGAGTGSPVFYSRVKGEMEAAVGALPYRAVTLLRPSFLAGERDERRPGEHLALAALGVLGRLVPARLRPVADATVARAMIAAAWDDAAGVRVFESEEIARRGSG